MNSSKIKKGYGAISLIVIILYSAGFVSAANIGVSPANADFPKVLRGGYAERPIRITLDTPDLVKISATVRGEIASWISLSEENFSASRSNPYTLIASVSPPLGTPNGRYEGFIRIQSDQTGRTVEGHATSLLIPALDVHVTVEVTDQEVRGCKASNFKISNVEEGDEIIFSADILNTGNIWFSPLISLTLWNQDNSKIVKEVRFSDTIITPTQNQKVRVEFPSEGLERGQYWVDAAAVDCYEEQTLTFDVLEEGALRAAGILTEIIAPVWVDLGETISIIAKFTNTGEKAVRSRFKGQVTLEDKIVQLFESDQEVFVDLEEDTEYEFYFTPKQAGRYLVSGRVFYDSKRTYEKSAAFNVRSKGQLFVTIIKVLTYLVLLAIIAFLLVRIRRERKSYKRGLKKFR